MTTMNFILEWVESGFIYDPSSLVAATVPGDKYVLSVGGANEVMEVDLSVIGVRYNALILVERDLPGVRYVALILVGSGTVVFSVVVEYEDSVPVKETVSVVDFSDKNIGAEFVVGKGDAA